MPSIRYTRDKRGYETVYVVHGHRQNQGQNQTRVLYLFRSPSHVAVGRKPLDEEAREALEHTHPDLRFDWHALGGEMSQQPRQDPSQPRAQREPRSHPPQQARAAAPAPAPMVVDDQSLLGKTLGAAEAARLRARYGDLLQRILRRSRGPEERDQLMERAHRLNPDDWADEMAVRAGVSTVDAEWDAIGGELPQRRRGRRGGRRRETPRPEVSAQVSAIIGEQGDSDDSPEGSQADQPRHDARGGDGNGVWTGTDPEPDRNDIPGDH